MDAFNVTIDEPWTRLAVCNQTDPEAFFPEKGGSNAAAKAICNRCPVTAKCLEYALANDERFGIWGGMSERERREMKRARPPAPPVRRGRPSAPPPHGTPARAQWDRRRGIKPRQESTDAETLDRKLRKHARPVTEPTVTEKACRACEITKPADEFRREVSRADGLDRICKVCKREQYQEWYQTRGRALRGRSDVPAVAC